MDFTLEDACGWPSSPLEKFVVDATLPGMLLSILALFLWLRRSPRDASDVLLLTSAAARRTRGQSLRTLTWTLSAAALVALHAAALALAIVMLLLLHLLAGWEQPATAELLGVAALWGAFAVGVLAWLRAGGGSGTSRDVLWAHE